MMGSIDYYFGDPVHCVNPVLVPFGHLYLRHLYGLD
jgi:hypothetical protein